MKKAKSSRKQLYHPPETVVAPPGYSNAIQDTKLTKVNSGTLKDFVLIYFTLFLLTNVT